MVKKKEKIIEEETGSNSNGSEMKAALEAILYNQQELAGRIDDMEKNTRNTDAALLRMVNLMYDTDDKHLPELTRIPIQAARPHALGMMLECLFDEDIQNGSVPLSKKLRLNYFRLMRSVGGIHLGRGVRLAEEQAAAETEKGIEMDLGDE